MLGLIVRPPAVADGIAMWQLASSTPVLDVNSAYAYALWCRDFAATSVVAEVPTSSAADGGRPIAGFVTGFRRPSSPTTLFVWQVAVDRAFRREGVAVELLVALVDRVRRDGITNVEATVSPSNDASLALFRSVARRLGTTCSHPVPGGFGCEQLPAGHEEEPLLRVGAF